MPNTHIQINKILNKNEKDNVIVLNLDKDDDKMIFFALFGELINKFYNSSVVNQTSPKKEYPEDVKGNIEALLQQKNLKASAMTPDLNLGAPINQHAAYLFEHIFSIPYPKQAKVDGIARFVHGLQHASRAAINAVIFVNLMRKYGDVSALKLADEDIKLVQLLSLFHDAGRETDGLDYWDRDSGILLYFYLKKLGVDEAKAKLLAEAIANKDADENGYYELTVNGNEFTWKLIPPRPKNIFQRALANGDCLDIIRARDCFDGGYLDFYKEIAQHNESAFEDMAEFIAKARSLINKQGDTFRFPQPIVKQTYECKEGYERIVKEIQNEKNYRLYALLYTPKHWHSQDFLQNLNIVDKTPYDKAKGITEENLKAAKREGKLFARGVVIPSATTKKFKNKNFCASTIEETFAQKELRKTARRKGVVTQSNKQNCTEKNGNPKRSISMLGYVFACAGFLVIDPNPASIHDISENDHDTDWAKKASFKSKLLGTPEDEIVKKLKNVLHRLKMGGPLHPYPVILERNFAGLHNEINCDLEDYDAIYFSKDPCMANMYTSSTDKPAHINSPLLQAVYLQQEYKKTYGKELSIVEFSNLNDTIRVLDKKDYSNEKLKAIWRVLCTDYFKNNSETTAKLLNLINKSEDEIKFAAVYGENSESNSTAVRLIDQKNSVDINYEPALKEEISELIHANLLIQQQRLTNLNKIEFKNDKERANYVQTIFSHPMLLQAMEKGWVEKVIINADVWEQLSTKIDSKAIPELFEKLGKEKLQTFLNSKSLLCFLTACPANQRWQVLDSFDADWLKNHTDSKAIVRICRLLTSKEVSLYINKVGCENIYQSFRNYSSWLNNEYDNHLKNEYDNHHKPQFFFHKRDGYDGDLKNEDEDIDLKKRARLRFE